MNLSLPFSPPWDGWEYEPTWLLTKLVFGSVECIVVTSMPNNVSPWFARGRLAGILADELPCVCWVLLQSGAAPKAMPNLIGDVVERDPEPLDSASAPAHASAPSQPVLVLEVRINSCAYQATVETLVPRR